MPTGYNEKVLDGEEGFKEYALRCVHAFTWEMRDMASGSPIPEPRRDTWAEEALEKLEQELREKREWTVEQWAAEEERERNETNREKRETLAKRAAVRDRIEKVLAQVEAYQPPSPAHEAYKKFMADQLTLGLQHEGREYDPNWDAEVPKRNPLQYATEKLSFLKHMVERYRESADEAEQKYKHNVEWRRLLLESLEGIE